MSKKCPRKTVVVFSVLLIWITVLYFVGPSTIIEYIGVTNGYVFVFVLAALGGVSALSATSFFSTIIAFSMAGLDPYILGVLGGIGVTIGDSIYFYLGMNGKRMAPERYIRWIDRFAEWSARAPGWVVPSIVYGYAAFTPFPNEIMTISMGLAGKRFKTIIGPLLLGNITITIIVAVFVR
jgi:hypothetical protein